MAKLVPYNPSYDIVEKNDSFSQAMLWCSVIVSIIILGISKIDSIPRTESTIPFLNQVNCFLAVSYFISDIVGNYLFQIAEAKRREDFFDNSLSTKLAEVASVDYFTNDHISAGVLKMGVNSFENSFFSKNISGKMLRKMLYKAALVLAIFLALALFTDRELLALALQLALPFTIIVQTIRLFLFHKRVEDIFKQYQKIFTATASHMQEQLILQTVTNYEALLAWACIKLDSGIFHSMNDELSQQWLNLKSRYDIR